MMQNLFTIGITAFREGSLLLEAFDSVNNQTFKNFKIIMVLDGNSDKKTRKIFDSISHPYITKIKLNENKGPYYCRTLAIKKSDTIWYCHLDADDKLPLDTLEILNEYHKSYPEYDYFWGQCLFFSNDSFFVEYQEKINLDLLAQSLLICGTSPIKVKLFQELNGFDEKLFWGYADWDFWIRVISQKYNGKFINKILYERRLSNHSVSDIMEFDRDKIIEIIINNNKEFYSKNDRESKSLGKTYEMMARKHRSLWNRRQAKEYAIKAKDVNWYFKAQDEIILEAGMNFFRYYVRKLRVLV